MLPVFSPPSVSHAAAAFLLISDAMGSGTARTSPNEKNLSRATWGKRACTLQSNQPDSPTALVQYVSHEHSQDGALEFATQRHNYSQQVP
jgi:hypothetical protein